MADLKDCSKIHAVKDRMDCIEGNLNEVNRVVEAVTRELRARLDDLKTRLESVEGNALKSGDHVTLSSFDVPNKADRRLCLTFVDDKRETRTQKCDLSLPKTISARSDGEVRPARH
jgi:anti-sigma factor ChrR (cupin superfamily)